MRCVLPSGEQVVIASSCTPPSRRAKSTSRTCGSRPRHRAASSKNANTAAGGQAATRETAQTAHGRRCTGAGAQRWRPGVRQATLVAFGLASGRGHVGRAGPLGVAQYDTLALVDRKFGQQRVDVFGELFRDQRVIDAIGPRHGVL